MCDLIFGGDRYGIIGTPPELAAVVGGSDKIVWDDDYSGVDADGLPDLCLCNVDVPATLTAAGIAWEEDPLGYAILSSP